MGAAIFTWVFFAIIWLFIIAAIVIATNTSLIDTSNENPQDIEVNIPEVVYYSEFFNPISAYSELISLNVGTVDTTSYENLDIGPPGYINSISMFLTMCVWLFTFLFLSFWRFNKKDI
jgi:ABC-type transport system involved in multi-copper enzyme maturation permease subunit